MMQASLSVIIPTFNRAHLLPEAISSVQRQTDAPKEIFIIDDGSEDHTKQVIDFSDNRIQYRHQNHGGLNAARNFALFQSKSQYIGLLDDDDLWLPWKTKVQIMLLEKFQDAAYIFSDFFIFAKDQPIQSKGLATWFKNGIDWSALPGELYDSDSLNINSQEAKSSFSIFKGNLYEALLYAPYILPSTAIIRRSAIDNFIKFPEDNIHCGDWAFFANLSRNHPCLYMDVETTLNRSHDDPVRLTRKKPAERLTDRIDLIERVWQADREFMILKESVVNELKNYQLLKLCICLLLDSQKFEAQAALDRIEHCQTIKSRYLFFFISIFTMMPGSSRLLQMILRFKRLFI